MATSTGSAKWGSPSFYFASGFNQTINTTARYYTIGGGIMVGTESSVSSQVFSTILLTNLYFKVGTVIAAGTNVTATLMTNGVASNLSASVTGTGASSMSITNSTSSVIVNNGDQISLKIIGNNVSAVIANQVWSIQCFNQ